MAKQNGSKPKNTTNHISNRRVQSEKLQEVIKEADQQTAETIAATESSTKPEVVKAESDSSPVEKAKKADLPTKAVRDLAVGDTFSYKSSKAVWNCTFADGKTVKMQKDGGKEWNVTKEKELLQVVHIHSEAPQLIEATKSEESAS